MPAIPKKFLQEIFRYAENDYPNECCGMILGFSGCAEFSRVKAFKNVQDEYHAQEPKIFPRTSRQAYFMDPKELLALQKELRASGEEIRVIYHSHIDVPAYFSEEDKRLALGGGAPLYPEVDYLIVSVTQKKASEACLYAWDSGKKEFKLIP